MPPTAHLLAPRYWGIHLLALVLVGAAVWLGVWQVEAWQTRRAAEAVDLTLVQPELLTEVIGADDPFPGDKVGQPVVVAGTWLPESTFTVSGRAGGPRGDDGSWLVTPLVVDGGQAAVLVVRGWTADPEAAPSPPTGAAELVAWLQPSEGSAVPDPDPDDDVLPALRVADAAQRVDLDLYGAYAVVADEVAAGDWPAGDLATNPGTEGLVPARPAELPRAGRFTALRNLLYGIEWWVFGGFAAFIWWRHMRDLRAARLAEQEAEAGNEQEAEPRDERRDEPGDEHGPDGGPQPDGHVVPSGP